MIYDQAIDTSRPHPERNEQGDKSDIVISTWGKLDNVNTNGLSNPGRGVKKEQENGKGRGPFSTSPRDDEGARKPDLFGEIHQNGLLASGFGITASGIQYLLKCLQAGHLDRRTMQLLQTLQIFNRGNASR